MDQLYSPPDYIPPPSEVYTPKQRASALDRALPALTSLMRRSEDARRAVTVGLNSGDVPPLLVSTPDPAYRERLRAYLDRLLGDAVRRSGRYAGAVAPVARSMTDLPASRVLLAETAYPAVRRPPTEEGGRLTVSVWVCPDRLTAIGLFWLRRRGDILGTGGGDTDRITSVIASDDRVSWVTIADDVVAYGDGAFWLDRMYGAPLPVRWKDEEAQACRYCFIRDNVVVEVAMPWYFYGPNGPRMIWYCERAHGHAPEFLSIAQAIDDGLHAIRMSRP